MRAILALVKTRDGDLTNTPRATTSMVNKLVGEQDTVNANVVRQAFWPNPDAVRQIAAPNTGIPPVPWTV